LETAKPLYMRKRRGNEITSLEGKLKNVKKNPKTLSICPALLLFREHEKKVLLIRTFQTPPFEHCSPLFSRGKRGFSNIKTDHFLYVLICR